MTQATTRPGARDGGRKRAFYKESFKIEVVVSALKRPASNRIKPTCACYPGIEPCQLRKWIRNLESTARAHMLADATSQKMESGKRDKAVMEPDHSVLKRKRSTTTESNVRASSEAKQTADVGCFDHPVHFFVSPDAVISLPESTPPESPQSPLYAASSRSTSTCSSPSASPKMDARSFTSTSWDGADIDPMADGSRRGAAVMPWGNPTAPDCCVGFADSMCRPWHMAVAMTPPYTSPLSTGPAGLTLPLNAGQDYLAITDHLDGATHPDGEDDRELSVDVMLMDSLLQEEAFAEDESPGWVEDWLSELMG